MENITNQVEITSELDPWILLQLTFVGHQKQSQPSNKQWDIYKELLCHGTFNARGDHTPFGKPYLFFPCTPNEKMGVRKSAFFLSDLKF